MSRLRRVWPHAVLSAAALLGVPFAAHAAPQSSAQQTCLNDMNKYGVRVAKSQNKASIDCVKNAGRGLTFRLGVPPTAQACLTNDVGGKVAKSTMLLQGKDTSRCLAAPEQLPAFGYTGTATTDGAARGAGLAMVAGLFGPDLDAAIVLDDVDADGARCQSDVLKYTTSLYYAIWKEALAAKKNALKGSNRVTGGNPNAPVTSAIELQAELVAVIQADAKGKIAKAATKLRDKTAQRCAEAQTPVAQMFPGSCSASAALTDLGNCAEALARGRFYQSLATADALAIDCDLTDNGVADLSCESAELREHVLNRLGYGGDAWSRARIQTLGVEGYIQEQLSPQTIDDSALDAALAVFPSLTQTFQQLRANYSNNPVPPQQGLNVIARELKQAKVLRAVMSRRQLREVLVDFWMNHFNVTAASSQRTKYDISPYDRIALRPKVLGTFEDILLANARSPAMGDYLDNRRNRVGALNENYSREVLELHTVGVTGPYTEADIPELARCLTGWEEDYANAVDGFEYRDVFHDQGTKTVMGVVIGPNGGINDGLTMIDFLAHHPSTAAFISRKLVIRFVSEAPPQRLVDEAAGVFLGTGGDLRAVVEAILLSPEFLAGPQYRHAKTKRPLVFYASLARALGANPTAINTNNLRNRVADMGEDLYDAGPPTGYPDVSSFWFSPGTAVKRFNDAEATSRGAYGFSFTYPVAGGTSAQVIDGLAAGLFVAPVSSDTRDVAIGFLDVLAPVEPNVTTRIRQAAAVLLSSPEFLTH